MGVVHGTLVLKEMPMQAFLTDERTCNRRAACGKTTPTFRRTAPMIGLNTSISIAGCCRGCCAAAACSSANFVIYDVDDDPQSLVMGEVNVQSLASPADGCVLSVGKSRGTVRVEVEDNPCCWVSNVGLCRRALQEPVKFCLNTA